MKATGPLVLAAALLVAPLALAAPPAAAPPGGPPAARAGAYSGHGAAKRENIVIMLGHSLAFLKKHLAP